MVSEPAALDAFDVVIVPFPFTDSAQAKRRPALVLSSAASLGDRIGHSVMAMITSAGNAPWPLDVAVTDLSAAGLPGPSVVRMKLFTLDHRLVVRRAGSLAPTDRAAVTAAIASLMPWVGGEQGGGIHTAPRVTDRHIEVDAPPPRVEDQPARPETPPCPSRACPSTSTTSGPT